jgi:hypothetical protein
LFVMSPVILDIIPDLAPKIGQFFSIPVSQIWLDNLRLFNNSVFSLYTNWSFLLMGIVIFVNRGNLKSLNIDDGFWDLYVVGGLFYIFYHLWPSGWLVALLMVLVFTYFRKMGIKFDGTTTSTLRMIRFIVIIFLLGLLLISFSLNMAKIKEAIHWFATEIPFMPIEEFIFRGLSWTVFKNLNWRESRILIVQAILFWLAHVNTMLSFPFYFWVLAPLLSITLGIVAWRCKSITPSTIAHILINIFLGFIQT